MTVLVLSVAPVRRNISFPAANPFYSTAHKGHKPPTHRPSIKPSGTAAAVNPQLSAAFSSHRPGENHPPARSLPSQIPIDGEVLTAFPRVPSSEAFGRRPYTGSTARAGPASETLPVSGHLPRPRT